MQFLTGGYLLWAVIMLALTVVLFFAVRRYYDALDARS
jgi:hypothetical protein